MKDVGCRYRRFGGFLFALLLSGVAAGCGLSTSRRTTPAITLPNSFGASATGKSQQTPDRWWTAFGDTTLSNLTRLVLAENLDLRARWARAKQIHALADQAASGRWPQISASASSGKSQSINPFFGSKLTTTQHSLSVEAAYEVDLWGRVRNGSRAAALDGQAMRLSVEAAAMTLVAITAENWFQLLEQRSHLKLLKRQIEASRTQLELVEIRFGLGLASSVNVYQQRQQLLSTRSELAPTEARIALVSHRLAVLTGRPPTLFELPKKKDLPQLPPLPATGIPSEVLKRRPDVQAAWLGLLAADHRVAAAVAERYPAIRLSASAGLSGFTLSQLVEQWVGSIGAGVVMPLFDAGRRRAKVRQQRAVVEEKIAVLGSVILVALREVQDALVLEANQSTFLEELGQQRNLAKILLRETTVRYRQGLSDFIPVLTAQQTLHTTERARLAAKRQLLSYRIQLYRALGGSWTSQLEPTILPANASAYAPTYTHEEDN